MANNTAKYLEEIRELSGLKNAILCGGINVQESTLIPRVEHIITRSLKFQAFFIKKKEILICFGQMYQLFRFLPDFVYYKQNLCLKRNILETLRTFLFFDVFCHRFFSAFTRYGILP